MRLKLRLSFSALLLFLGMHATGAPVSFPQNTYPKWLDEAVIYHIYPSSFMDSDGDGVGDLEGIRSRLDYVRSLGVNTLWLSPVFCSCWEDGGYDITDYYRIDPRFGSNEDFYRLVRDVHARGMRLCMDLVMGHTSDKHPWFAESAKGDPSSPYYDYYIWTPDKSVRPEGKKWVDRDYPRGGYYLMNYYDIQPALNFGYYRPDPSHPWEQGYDAPGPTALRAEMKRFISFWCEKGVDGFRCDMAYSLVKGDDEAFHGVRRLWNEIFTYVGEKNPDCIFLSEWSSPVEAVSCGFDIDIIRHNGCGKTMYRDLLHTTVRNADPKTGVYAPKPFWFDRAGSGRIDRFVKPFIRMWETTRGHGFPCMPTSSHDTWRMNRGPRSTQPELEVCLTFFLTMPWVPVLYYGEEIGMRSMDGVPPVEGSRDRASSRTPMQWGDGPTAGFSRCDPARLYLPVDTAANRPTVEAQEKDPASLLHFTRDLLAFRRRTPAFATTADWRWLSDPDQAYPAVYERSAAGERYLVILNPREAPAETKVSGIRKLEVVRGNPEALKCRREKGGLTLRCGGVSAVICRVVK